MKEITLNLKTVKIPSKNSYSIEDMERMFGKRIKKAVNNEPNKNGKIYKGIIAKKMTKICKKWKFWNTDIRKAYKNYVGMILVPWVINYSQPIISYGINISDKMVNEIVYQAIKNENKSKTSNKDN